MKVIDIEMSKLHKMPIVCDVIEESENCAILVTNENYPEHYPHRFLPQSFGRLVILESQMTPEIERAIRHA